MPTCPICSATDFEDYKGRKNARCCGCQSMERTRTLYAMLQRLKLPVPGSRVLHIAPEPALALKLIETCGAGYVAADLFDTRLTTLPPGTETIHPLDLCGLPRPLEGRSFDLIIHSHVMEHVLCNWALVLLLLNTFISPGGFHVFSFPLKGDYCAEDISPLVSQKVRTREFGQRDHARRIGRKSLPVALGMIAYLSGVPQVEEARKMFSPEEIKEMGLGGSVFYMRLPENRLHRLTRLASDPGRTVHLLLER